MRLCPVFAAVLAVGDTGRALTVEKNLRRQCVCFNSQIRPFVCRPQVTNRRARPPPTPCRQLIVTSAFLGLAVEVVVAWNAGLFGRGNKCLGQFMRFANV